LRYACEDKEERTKIFGPEKVESNSDHASSVQFSDQRLLLLPVRSLAGTFAWVTSPYVLRRFAREALDVGLNALPEIPPLNGSETCLVSEDNCQLIVAGMNKVYLEDLDLTPETQATEWANWLAGRVFNGQAEWQTILQQRVCIVHDDLFSFLLKTAMEVTARIKLQEDTKTVQQGGLWYEEALPTETILSGLVMADPTHRSGCTDEEVFQVVERIINSKQTMQFGGKATVGRGLCRMQLVKGGQ
jgi:CRISPR-associated protein Cmr4